MVFECEQPVDGQPVFTVQSVASCDDGVTWSTTRELVYAATGDRNNAGSPQIATVVSAAQGDGYNTGNPVLVTVFMTDEDTGLHQWVNGSSVKMLLSADGGSTWGGKVLVGGVQSNWPGVLSLGDTDGDGKGEVLVLYESGGSKVTKVVVG